MGFRIKLFYVRLKDAFRYEFKCQSVIKKSEQNAQFKMIEKYRKFVFNTVIYYIMKFFP